MNWTAVGIVGTLVVSLAGSLFGLIQARLAAKDASRSRHARRTTETIELGVRELVDQYRESNADLHQEVRECKGRCEQLEAEVKSLRVEVERLTDLVDEREAQIIQLKRRIGDPL